VSRVVDTRGTIARTIMEFLIIAFFVMVLSPFKEYIKWYLLGIVVGTLLFLVSLLTRNEGKHRG
jgi:hypothetical protein